MGRLRTRPRAPSSSWSEHRARRSEEEVQGHAASGRRAGGDRGSSAWEQCSSSRGWAPRVTSRRALVGGPSSPGRGRAPGRRGSGAWPVGLVSTSFVPLERSPAEAMVQDDAQEARVDGWQRFGARRTRDTSGQDWRPCRCSAGTCGELDVGRAGPRGGRRPVSRPRIWPRPRGVGHGAHAAGWRTHTNATTDGAGELRLTMADLDRCARSRPRCTSRS